jgi:hypothetical protein
MSRFRSTTITGRANRDREDRAAVIEKIARPR